LTHQGAALYIPIIKDSLGAIKYEGNGPLNRYLNYSNDRYFISIDHSILGENCNDIHLKSCQLFQNFPNPFNPITKIEYELPKTELVPQKIFDIMGREVVSLVNEIQKPGRNFSLWDAKHQLGQSVSAGTYIYIIQAGKFIQAKKMVLLK
tara:strand:+ start:387 stop:836 length:450 start_codon:yes stop_codon:yes gene_type:complete